MEAHIPGSASETAPPSVINPLSPKDAKEKSPLDNAGGEGGGSGSEAGGERVGNNRRRRKHSSASEGEIKDCWSVCVCVCVCWSMY